jgi:hypothetical protein
MATRAVGGGMDGVFAHDAKKRNPKNAHRITIVIRASAPQVFLSKPSAR